MIAGIRRIVLAAIIAAEIEFLVFFRQLEIVVVDIFFKVEICFIVLVLIEIAVFYAVDCYLPSSSSFAPYCAHRLRFSNGCVDTIPRAEQRERGVFQRECCSGTSRAPVQWCFLNILMVSPFESFMSSRGEWLIITTVLPVLATEAEPTWQARFPPPKML